MQPAQAMFAAITVAVVGACAPSDSATLADSAYVVAEFVVEDAPLRR